MSKDSFQQLAHQVLEVTTKDRLTSICARVSEIVGAEQFCYIDWPLRQNSEVNIFIEGRAGEAEEYSGVNIINRQWIDRLARTAEKQTTPIYWSYCIDAGCCGRRCAAGDDSDGQPLSGIAFPVHDYYKVGVFSLASNHSETRMKPLFDFYSPHLHYFSMHLYEAVRRLMRKTHNVGLAQPISIREQECLQWVSEGMSAAQISELLEVAESTVTYHLRNATKKLSAVNRQQAVARAVSLGLIEPSLR